MKETNGIIRRIGEVAQLLHRQQMKYSRADLAYELSNYGIKEDSSLLDEYVWEAFETYKFSKDVFLTNDMKHLIIDEYEIRALQKAGKDDSVSALVKKHLQETKGFIEESQNLARTEKGGTLHSASSFLSTIKGTSGVERVKAEAEYIFDRYSELVESYNIAHTSAELVITDFVELRLETLHLFFEFANALVDIFGDSVKVINPNLFDYSKIQWLDVSSMLEQTRLEYSTVSTKCSVLLNEISENFSETLKRSSSQYHSSQNKSVGLIMAATNFIEHYMNASAQTMNLQSDLLCLKKSMQKDATQIRGDLMRVFSIYKTLNDVYIPKTLWFNKYAKGIFVNQMQSLLAQLYKEPALKQISAERNNLVAQLKEVDRNVYELQKDIDYYTDHIAECKQILKSEENNYRIAKSSQPSKPFFLFDLLSLGSLGRNYKRDLYEWTQCSLPIVQSYDALVADIQMDEADLENTTASLKREQNDYKRIRMKLQNISVVMKEKLSANNEIKKQILPFLKDYIKLLVIAKEITETKLDEKMVGVVTITKVEDVSVSKDVAKNINSFISDIQAELSISESSASGIVSFVGPDSNVSDSDLQMIAARGNALIQKGAELCKQMIEMQAQKEEYAKDEQYYENELQKLKDAFAFQMKDVESSSQIILKIASQLNSTVDQTKIKDALMTLSENRKDLYSDEELNDFLNGKITINI